ncbi:hypothetical protein MYRNA_268 [Mycobacterium phage Myrna]|uniref:Uncharacterized protein n=1 Tax=Mycobacterium phage Myrna TaxID=546805 RepID=B5LJN8_9CAUD|nr:gp268 [Mycobacterium phage Myrna]ACH62235.1 hypothetical protein MYRNA_268 [Mycobacterium phage Myrna]
MVEVSEPIFKGLPGTIEQIRQAVLTYQDDVISSTAFDDLMETITEIVRRYGNEQTTVALSLHTAAQESSFSSNMGVFQQRQGSYERHLAREYEKQAQAKRDIETIFQPGHTVTVTDIPPTNNRGSRA